MNDLSFIDFLAQSYNSSPDWIKFAWIFGFSAIILALIVCGTWLTIHWRELANERLAIKTNHHSRLEEREQLKQVTRFYSDDLPWHIKRQENYLPEYDKENLDAWLLNNKQAIEELRQKTKADSRDYESNEVDWPKAVLPREPSSHNNKKC